MRTATLNLNSSDLATTAHTQLLTGATLQIPGPTASWLSGNVDGVVSNPAEPALPLKVVNVTPTVGTIVLRGVGFRGGAYSDSLVVPLTGAPATEIRGVHTSFASPSFFPARPWTANYFGALAGNGATSLLVTPAQHRAADLDPAGTGALRSTLRSYSNLDLRLYYSSNRDQVSLSDAPSIVAVGAQPDGTGNVTFTAQVTGDPAAAIYEVWITYTTGSAWVSVRSEPMQSGRRFRRRAARPRTRKSGKAMPAFLWAAAQFVVQAVNGLGLVAFDDNRGAYYTFTGAVTLPAPAQTVLAFESPPTSARYGDAVNVTARLTSNSQPVPGAVVNVNVGGIPNSGLTDANGRLTLSATIANAPGNYTITASVLGKQHAASVRCLAEPVCGERGARDADGAAVAGDRGNPDRTGGQRQRDDAGSSRGAVGVVPGDRSGLFADHRREHRYRRQCDASNVRVAGGDVFDHGVVPAGVRGRRREQLQRRDPGASDIAGDCSGHDDDGDCIVQPSTGRPVGDAERHRGPSVAQHQNTDGHGSVQRR